MRRLPSRGLVESLPLLPANFLWGVAFGAAASVAGLPAAGAILMSAVAWSGTAQMAALGELHQPLIAIFATSLLLSLRFIPISVVLGRLLSGLGTWRRGLLSCMIADASFALLLRVEDDRARYLAGTWAGLYVTWVMGTALGALTGPLIPRGWLSASDALIGAIFAVLTVQSCAGWRAGAVAVAAAAAALLAAAVGLPEGLAILLVSVVVAGAGAAALR